VPRVREEVVVT